MSQPGNLFHQSRFPAFSLVKILSLILYVPIGCALVILRGCIGLVTILLASALPDVTFVRYLLTRLFCITFGIIVEKEGSKDERVKMIVSNHISNLDHLALHVAGNCLKPSQYRMHEMIQNCLGLLQINTPLNYDLIQSCKAPVLVFPEDFPTNGNGLLKFKSHVFEHDFKIQPVAMRLYRPPIGELNVSTLGGDWSLDIFSYLFVPFTLYNVNFLPVQEKNGVEANEFSEKVRDIIAESLQVPKVNLSATDMVEYEKRYLKELSQMTRPNNLPTSRNIQMMANQVKEVLPTVPISVIIKDLEKSRSVDQTVTNILEGHVPYTPEPPTPVRSSCSPTSSTKFAKSSSDRVTSFEERKRSLIETARLKYILKHNIKLDTTK